MIRHFVIIPLLTLLALCSAADAAELRVRWTHEGAAEFVVVVDQPMSPQPASRVVSWRAPEADADGWFVLTVGGVDPAHDADVHVVAIAADGRPSAPSNEIRVTQAEFCGTATCDDGLNCTMDVCGTDFCANTPTVSRCDDFDQCTQDVCDLVRGCTHLRMTASCDDGLDCTDFDNCASGACSGVDNCTEGSFCSPVTGNCESASSTTTLPFSTSTTSLPTTTSTTTLADSVCGNGLIEAAEQCDDGDRIWQSGDSCRANCSLVNCGDADGSGGISILDALYILSAALAGNDCDPSVCSIGGSPDRITATDALRLLRILVGLAAELDCPEASQES